MGLKILHSADWHLDSPFAGFSERQRAFLKSQLNQIPGKVADLCRRESCDLVLLAGDLFEGIPSRETVELVKRALADCAVPVLISPGNHDFCQPGSPWLEETWPENVYIFKGGLECVAIADLNCRVYGAGFQSIDCPGLLEGFQAEGEERYQLGLFHGDPAQKGSPYNPITQGQVRRSGLHYLALGHIHKAGAFRAGKTLCAWPGCPMGRGWDETGDKGLCIVMVEEDAQIKAVSLDLVHFHDLELDMGKDAAAALEGALPGQGSQDFYRIALTGWGEISIPALQAQFSGFPNLELRDRTQPPMDVWAVADEDSLEGVFFGKLRQQLEEDPDNADTIQLAAEISRRILLGREVVL